MFLINKFKALVSMIHFKVNIFRYVNRIIIQAFTPPIRGVIFISETYFEHNFDA